MVQHRSRSDQELLALAADGDPEALIALFDLHAPSIKSRLIADGLTEPAAEVVLLETFRAFWVIAPRVRTESSVIVHLLDLVELHRER